MFRFAEDSEATEGSPSPSSSTTTTAAAATSSSFCVIDLPDTLILRCLRYLEAKDILAFALSCSSAWKLLQSDNNTELWKDACHWTRDVSTASFDGVHQGGESLLRVYSALMRIRKATKRYRCSRLSPFKKKGKRRNDDQEDELTVFGPRVCLKQCVKACGIAISRLSEEDLRLLLMGSSLVESDTAFVTRGVYHENCFGEPLFTFYAYRAFGTLFTEEEPCLSICFNSEGDFISVYANKAAIVEDNSNDHHHHQQQQQQQTYDIFEMMKHSEEGYVGISELCSQGFLTEKHLYPFRSSLCASVVLSSIVRHVIERNRNLKQMLTRVSILHGGCSSQGDKTLACVRKSVQFIRGAGFPVIDFCSGDGQVKMMHGKKDLEKILKGCVLVHNCKSGSGTAYLSGQIGAVVRELSNIIEGKGPVPEPVILVIPGVVNSSKSHGKKMHGCRGGPKSVETAVIKRYLTWLRLLLLEKASVKQVLILCDRSADAELYRRFIIPCFESNCVKPGTEAREA